MEVAAEARRHMLLAEAEERRIARTLQVQPDRGRLPRAWPGLAWPGRLIESISRRPRATTTANSRTD
jgi:hypothetical protein